MAPSQGIILIMLAALTLFLLWSTKSPFNKPFTSTGGKFAPGETESPHGPKTSISEFLEIPPGSGNFVGNPDFQDIAGHFPYRIPANNANAPTINSGAFVPGPADMVGAIFSGKSWQMKDGVWHLYHKDSTGHWAPD